MELSRQVCHRLPRPKPCPLTLSSSCRYFELLRRPGPPSLSPILHHVFACLSSRRVSHTVTACVLEMALNLLGRWPHPLPHPLPRPLSQLGCTAPAGQPKPAAERASNERGSPVALEEGGGCGPALLAPFVPVLLGHLGSVLGGGGVRAEEGGGLRTELSLLSRWVGPTAASCACSSPSLHWQDQRLHPRSGAIGASDWPSSAPSQELPRKIEGAVSFCFELTCAWIWENGPLSFLHVTWSGNHLLLPRY